MIVHFSDNGNVQDIPVKDTCPDCKIHSDMNLIDLTPGAASVSIVFIVSFKIAYLVTSGPGDTFNCRASPSHLGPELGIESRLFRRQGLQNAMYPLFVSSEYFARSS